MNKRVADSQCHDDEKQRIKKKNIRDANGNPVPREGGCHFLMKQKNRYCNFKSIPGHQYCGNHLQTATEGERVVCPLDSRHTVYVCELEHHLKICNATKKLTAMENQPFYNAKVNDGTVDDTSYTDETKLADFSDEEVQYMIASLDKYLEKCPSFQTELKNVESDNTTNAVSSRERHLIQEEAILEQVKASLNISSFKPGICFVEMGCGKGGLSVAARGAMPKDQVSRHLLVDRDTFQCKKDRYIESPAIRERVRIDIRDLVLDNVDILQEYCRCESPTVALISKHLCGVATCYSLRCATNAVNSMPNSIVIALCCHHLCSWSGYINKEFLSNLGISRRQFNLIRVMSSWGLSGFRGSELLSESEKESRRLVGLKCKSILNLGRVEYLNQNGYIAKLVPYISESTTKENMLLVARRL